MSRAKWPEGAMDSIHPDRDDCAMSPRGDTPMRACIYVVAVGAVAAFAGGCGGSSSTQTSTPSASAGLTTVQACSQLQKAADTSAAELNAVTSQASAETAFADSSTRFAAI